MAVSKAGTAGKPYIPTLMRLSKDDQDREIRDIAGTAVSKLRQAPDPSNLKLWLLLVGLISAGGYGIYFWLHRVSRDAPLPARRPVLGHIDSHAPRGSPPLGTAGTVRGDTDSPVGPWRPESQQGRNRNRAGSSTDGNHGSGQRTPQSGRKSTDGFIRLRISWHSSSYGAGPGNWRQPSMADSPARSTDRGQ